MIHYGWAGAVATFVSLAAILFPWGGVSGALSAPGTSPVSAVTRNNNGDMFTAPGDSCDIDTCVGLSSGTAAPIRPNDGRSCTCRCLDHLPAYRDDLRICVDDIHECALAPFVSGSTSQQIPFVFLPLKGQIVHPSKEISFAGVKTPVCAVSGAQFLTEGGWVELRNPIDNDVPFRLFRDEGRTFLQWLGDPDLRIKMAGRLILVQMLCKDLAKDPTATDLRSIFTPCVAFRVVGTPAKYINNVREVLFTPDAHASNSDTAAGLTVSEYIAIGICSILLGLIYVASVFLYLHIRRRRRKEGLEKDLEKIDDQSLAPGEEGIIKNNPLLSLGRHFTGPDNTFSDSGDSDDLTPDILQHQDDSRKKGNMQVTSAIIHPLHDNFSMALCSEPIQLQDSSSIERLPEENVSIIETLEGREERPETVKTIVSATTRRKLYFNPAYFEPHLLLAPPPAAIEFLTKIREVIAIAKHKMATKRFTPSLLGIPEEDSNHSMEHMYEFPLGPASSRRGSIISLKRENSRRKVQCSGCPGCEPQDLKSLCGKLPEFPSIAVCQTCSVTSSSSVSESKQQSIRKWLEDVPILKSSNDEDEEISIKSVKSIRDMPLPETPNSYKRIRSATFSTSSSAHNESETKQIKRAISPDISFERIPYDNLPQDRSKSPIRKPSPTITKKSASEKTKSPPRTRPMKARAPPPPVPKQNPQTKKPTLPEDFKPNITNHYDVIRNVKPSVKNLPPPDMINEAMVVDKAEDVPQVTKQKMAAVINEFASHVGIEDKPKVPENPKDYEADSLERNSKAKNGYSTPSDYGDVSSSQPSPSLSTALPMDEEMMMQNAIVDIKTINQKKLLSEDEEHEYELIILNKNDKKPLLEALDKKLYRLPELLQRNNGYNLVSEVYVNNGYNFGSTPSTPTDSNSSTLENQKPKIRYEQPEEKPGHLTIEVEDCPDNYIRVDDSDSFEPDTLDRKSTKFKLSSSSSGTFSSDYVDSLERPNKILLKTTGSFKSDTLNNASEIGYALNSNFHRTFGSLREIYEAKTNKNYLRPSLDNINFMNPIPVHSPSDTLQKKLSWSKYQETEEGRLLTLEERQKKRQRQSPNGTVRQIPPDVIPPVQPNSIESPIYEQPKPPRKVVPNDKFKPPLPPKNGMGRNTSLKLNSPTPPQKGTPISSPTSTISFKLSSSPSGVSARSIHTSDGGDHYYEHKNKSILKSFIHSDDVVFKNGINNQFILHAKTVTPNFHEPFILNSKYDTIKMSPNILSNYSYTKHSDEKSEAVKKTWRKIVDSTSNQHKEDSGYLSTDSNESIKKKNQTDKESETDESSGDGHSESGAESIETHSVFFGTYRKLSRVAESIDSGVGSDSFRRGDSIVLLPQSS